VVDRRQKHKIRDQHVKHILFITHSINSDAATEEEVVRHAEKQISNLR